MSYFLECCCQDAQNARTAQSHGASRIELCEDLAHDGVTPSKDNICRTLHAVTIPVNVLIRCHPGDFVYTDEDLQHMLQSIALCRDLCVTNPDGRERRVNAVVIGALDKYGDIDKKAVQQMVNEARLHDSHLAITFHRAFDVCRDPLQAYTVINEMGIERILTSGHASSAMDGRALLSQLVQQSHAGGTQILVGGGVRPSNIDILAKDTCTHEFHSSHLIWDD